ncbi:MAG: hypothetical protein GKR96_04070 [Gammaproteobacteria bacterium]|nr:hypothetical protein [Gammaproteobacteria bacterium]
MKRILIVLVIFLSQFANADNQVIKNNIDEKRYRALTLENGLKVLLISDQKADVSAAALDVHVGSGNDPDEWDGLAHFLEHMLFLGNGKYPEAGEYQEFIKSQGGSHNAYTALAHTNYFFTIHADKLLPALDRFSRFFIDPLFDEVYVDRERAVVHSEYQARMKDEGRRIWDAGKVLLNPKHPAAGFTVGSLETLRDREGVSAREKLIEFYNEHYSASIMTLVVLGKEPLEQLEQWVAERFSVVENKNSAIPVFSMPYTNKDLMPARLNILPEKDQNSLIFQFPVPSTFREYQSKPLSYIANLLGHEGEGSLLARLKSLGWAEGLSAGSGYLDTVNGSFSVSVKLTQNGLKHIDEIGSLLFQTISLIEHVGVEDWRYQEESQLAQIAFQFSGEASPGNLVQSLASRMHQYETQDLLSGPYLMTEFKSERIHDILSYLTPTNVNITVIAKEVATDFDTRTAYYDVAYALEKISEESLDIWNESRTTTVDYDNELAMPTVNPYIPERLEAQTLKYPSIIPMQIKGQDTLSPWYHADTDFYLPKASFYFSVKSPFANDSPLNSASLDVMMRLLNEQLSTSIYPAYLAGLSYSLYRHSHGFSVRINGFEDKQSALLSQILGAIQTPKYDSEKINIIKSDLTRQWQNSSKDSPSNQTIREIYRLVVNPSWSESEKLSAIASVSADTLKSYFELFFSKVSVNVLSHGDVSFDKTVERSNSLNKIFAQSEMVLGMERAQPRRFSEGTNYLRTMDVEHNDSALVMYFQGRDRTTEERAKMSLLVQLIESPFYHDLRTTHRVGYLVHANSMPILELPGLFFSAQSPGHSPSEMETLMNNFLEQFEDRLDDVSDVEYQQILEGLNNRLLARDKKLTTRSGRYWTEIDLGKYDFDTREKIAEQISALKLEDMKAFFREVILQNPRKLVIQTLGQGYSGDAGLVLNEKYVNTGNVVEFRERNSL